MRELVVTFCLMLLTLSPIVAFIKTAEAATLANVYIDPPQTTGLIPGDNVTVNVNVANVSDLAGWEFQLFYNPQVLNATAVEEGSFLKSVENTYFLVVGMDDNYNSTHGRVYVACTTMPVTGVSGSGTLANVTFQVVGQGASVLALPQDTTKLEDSTPSRPQPILHTTTDGFIGSITNDIAITSIHLSKTMTSPGTHIPINVTASNFGNFTASFNVTLFYDSAEIGTQTVTNLDGLTNINLTFTWDTTSIPKGNYTISAYAPPIIGESNTENNRLADGWIKISIMGDVNGDGKVNIVDISIVATSWQTKPGDLKWNPNADLDDNQVINIIDITKVAKEFGKTDP